MQVRQLCSTMKTPRKSLSLMQCCIMTTVFGLRWPTRARTEKIVDSRFDTNQRLGPAPR